MNKFNKSAATSFFNIVNLVLVIFFAPAVFSSDAATTNASDLISKCRSNEPDALRIIVVSRRDSIETDSLQRGVLAACDESAGIAINVIPLVYDGINDGFKLISNIVEDKEADLIIGPSESQLYANLIEFMELKEKSIPIISPLVTLPLGNDPENWFFRTNVDVIKRTQTMFEFLSKRGIQNFSLLYVDRAFGEKSESAFRNEIGETIGTSLSSYRFATVEDARPWIRQIDQARPEAIGIIGTRDDVQRISYMLRNVHNEWNSYDPYIFSIIDTRTVAEEGNYFLSIAQEENKQSRETDSEVLGLAFDTTILAINISKTLKQENILPSNEDWSTRFRSRLIAVLGSSQASKNSKTGMVFSGLVNVVKPKVLTINKGQVEDVYLSPSDSLRTPVENWLDIRKRRFGSAPLINIFIISVLVIVLTIFDLKRAHRIHANMLFLPPFLVLMVINAAVANLVFIIMAEQGVLEWDSMLAALLVSLGYTGLLKTTLFESETGQVFGAKRYYDNLINFIYDRIRKKTFEKMGPIINYIAYTNSKTYLRASLLESYGFANDEKRKQVLIDRCDEVVAKELSTIGQRMVLAKAVWNELSWEKMVERRILPKGVARDEVIDPEPLLDKCVEYCLQKRSMTLAELKDKVLVALDCSNLHDEFNIDFDESTTPRSKMLACFRWLMLLEGFNENVLIEKGYLPEKPIASTDSVREQKRGEERVVAVDNVEVELAELNKNGTLINVSNLGARIRFDGIEEDVPQVSQLTLIKPEGKNNIIDIPYHVINKKMNSNGSVEVGVCWQKLPQPIIENIRKLVNDLGAVA